MFLLLILQALAGVQVATLATMVDPAAIDAGLRQVQDFILGWEATR